MLQRLLAFIAAEPAAVGALLSTVLPALVVLGVLQVDERTIAAVVVLINALVGFAVRLAVVPNRQGPGGPSQPATAG